MSIAIRKYVSAAASEGRRGAPQVAAVRWDAGKVRLGLKGLAVSYFLWACIFFSQTAFDPAQAVAAPAAVSSVSPS